jgi:(p)ppGpp synthase/HD superfamily hydrolase
MALSRRFEEALVFAAHRHRDHFRKASEVPYVSHLLAVAALVMEHGGEEDAVIAALLHDAVEDQKATLRELRDLFGDEVAAVVDACSDTDEDPKPPWRERKVAFLETIPSMSAAAKLVVAADKLHNVRSIVEEYRLIGEEVWERFSGGRDGSLWYYESVAQALIDNGAIPPADVLQCEVAVLLRLSAKG